jgi:ribose transport system substrate-binding protein
MGVDLIITSPNEARPLTNVVKKAYEAGIPVILLDRKIEGDTYTQFIGADNVLIGRECGKYVATVLLPDGGKIARSRAWRAPPAASTAITASARASRKTPSARSSPPTTPTGCARRPSPCREMLQAHDDIDLFFALHVPMAEGAYIAAKNAGREKDILFVGGDGLPTTDGGIKSVMDGRLSLSMVYPTGGKEAVESAYKLLVKGEELEKNVTLGTEAITPETAPEIYARMGGQ